MQVGARFFCRAVPPPRIKDPFGERGDGNHVMGLLAALLSAVFASAKDLVSKKLASGLDGTASTFASFAFALPFYAVLLIVLWLLGQETFTCYLAFLGLVR